jgi:heat shock protein HslJ
MTMKTFLTLLIGTSISLFQVTAEQLGTIAQADASIQQLAPSQLVRSEWRLKDLGDSGVINNLQTTLRFDSRDRISGQGGCNRYTAPVKLAVGRLTVSAIASTKKLCSPAVMNQENRYFQALQNAERVSSEGPYLLVYSQNLNVSLRFTHLTTISTAQKTLVAFQGRQHAVRVFTRNGQTQMNVYDQRDRIIWVRGASVKAEQTPEGTLYANTTGEARLVVFVPRAGQQPTLTINGKVDR